MKKLFSPSFLACFAAGTALFSVALLNSNAQQVQPAPKDAHDLKVASQMPDAPPVPPELQGVVDTFAGAFIKGDDKSLATLDRCWHPSANLVAAPRVESASPVVREREQQMQRNANDMAETKVRATQLRRFISVHLGGSEQLKFLRAEVSRGAADNTANENSFDDVKLHFLIAGAIHVVVSIDDVAKIDGQWKFRGPLKKELTIIMPTVE